MWKVSWFAGDGMQQTIASSGRGILAMAESNAAYGKRLASIGLENNEVNGQAYRQLLPHRRLFQAGRQVRQMVSNRRSAEYRMVVL